MFTCSGGGIKLPAITPNIGIRTVQAEESGEHVIIDYSGWLLTDVIICNHSDGYVTLLAKDDEGHEHVITSLEANSTFNHSFRGWRFWEGARLYLVKESDDGFCNVSVGAVRSFSKDYSIWRQL